MHDLLRLFARTTCQEADGQADREAAEARLVGYYVDLAGTLDSCVHPELRSAAARAAEQGGVPLPSMREALALFGAERPGLLAAVGLAAQRGWDEQVLRLAENTGRSLGVLRYLDDLLAVREAELAAARRAGNTRVEGRALNDLGEAYRELRRLGGHGCYEQALAIRRETGDRHGEGQALNNLGNAYVVLRRFEEAIGCYEQSLAILPGGRRPARREHGPGQPRRDLRGAAAV